MRPRLPQPRDATAKDHKGDYDGAIADYDKYIRILKIR